MRFEIHEFLSLGMLVALALLYSFGLPQEGLVKEIWHVAATAGPITVTVTGCMVLLLAAGMAIPGGRIASHARLLGRVMASFLVMLFAFEAVTHYITARGLPLRDALLQRWDSILFGGKQPAEWLAPYSNQAWTLLLSGAYLSWFFFTYGTIFLMWRKGRKALLEYAAAALLTFYAGYLLYIVVPGVGPIFTVTYSTPLGGLTAMMTNKQLFQPAADVFPSLHTALSVIMLLAVWRHAKRALWLYAPAMLLIVVSTVYLRIHYGIDVLAGILLALLTAWAVPQVLFLWEKRRSGISLAYGEKLSLKEETDAKTLKSIQS